MGVCLTRGCLDGCPCAVWSSALWVCVWMTCVCRVCAVCVPCVCRVCRGAAWVPALWLYAAGVACSSRPLCLVTANHRSLEELHAQRLSRLPAAEERQRQAQQSRYAVPRASAPAIAPPPGYGSCLPGAWPCHLVLCRV